MSDNEAIRKVLTAYAISIDSRDWDTFRSCFTKDCELDYGAIGKWHSDEAVCRYMALCHSGPSLHRVSNFWINASDERATSRCYVDAMVFGPGGIGGAHTIGYYDDELVHSENGWKIRKRTFTAVRMKFLGLLSVLPSRLTIYLAALGSRKLNKSAGN
jgi:hypothetical protein